MSDQAVIDVDLVPLLIRLVETVAEPESDEEKVCMEAAWALSNAACLASSDQVNPITLFPG